MKIALLVLLITVPVLAQEPPPSIKDVLQLDTAQVSTLERLLEQRRVAVEPLARQMGEAQQALGAALNATSPDPATIGNALLAIRAVQKQVEQKQREFADAFLASLTDGQRAQVQQIRGVEAALRAGQALHAIGL